MSYPKIVPDNESPDFGQIYNQVVKIPKYLYFEFGDDRLQYYNFLSTQSTNTIVLSACLILSVIFTAPFTSLMNVEEKFYYLKLSMSIRAFRAAFLFFAWTYYSSTRGKKIIESTQQFWGWSHPVVLGNHILVWNALSSSLLLFIRCWIGECKDDQNSYECNPSAPLHSFPVDTFLGHVLLLVLLPTIFKLHDPSVLFGSWILCTLSIFVGAYYVKSSPTVLIITFAGVLAIGVLMHERERDMICMFLTIRENRSYYEKLFEMERKKTRVELEKDNLRNLLGNVAHDLKTPLQAFMSELSGLQIEMDSISSHLWALRSESAGSYILGAISNVDEAQVYLNSLRDIYQFMMMAINRAIEFRKATTGFALLPSSTTFELIPAVKWAVDLFTNNPSGVEVKVEKHSSCQNHCPMIISDKHWLSENILCLGSNACKFTSRGKIVIRCSIVYEAAIKLPTVTSFINDPPCSTDHSTNGTDGLSHVVYFDPVDSLYIYEPAKCHHDAKCFVLIVVEDSGVGVPVDKRKRLFQPFGQAQRRTGGTGLGLFSLLKRMEALGGKCGMCDRPDKLPGSWFWFSFPYIPDQANHTRNQPNSDNMVLLNVEYRSSSIHTSNSSGKLDCRDSGSVYGTCSGKVLLVDDSALILKTTTRMLVKLGFDVEIAQNGFDALNLMKEHQYLFVLTDIQMPVMDGIEATQRIRAHENEYRMQGVSSLPQIIIGMSADSDAETKRIALVSGMNAFLSKPIHINELLKCLPRKEAG